MLKKFKQIALGNRLINYLGNFNAKNNLFSIDYLIHNSNLSQKNKYGKNPLMIVFYDKNIRDKLNKEQFDYLIYNTDLNTFYLHKNSLNPLMVVFSYNKEQELNLSKEHFDYLIHNTDLKKADNNGWNTLMLAIRYNKEQELNLSKEQFDYLIHNTGLNQTNENGWNTLMFAIRYNKEQELNLSKEQFDYLIANTDLNKANENGRNTLMFAIRYNKEQELNLSKEQFDYLIHNTDLNKANENGRNTLMFALIYNKEQELNLSKEQFDYLIHNTDLNKANENGWNPLMLALRYNKEQELNLSKEQFDYLIANTDLNQVNDNGWTPLMIAIRYNKELDIDLNNFILNTSKEQINKIRVNNSGYNYLLNALENLNNLSTESLEYLLTNSNLEWRTSNGDNWVSLYFNNIEKLHHPVSDEITKKLFEHAQENKIDITYIFSNLVKLNKSAGFKLEDPHFNFLIEQITQEEYDLYPLFKSYIKYSNNVDLKESTINKILINTNLNLENIKEIIELSSFNNCLSLSQWRFILVNTVQYKEEDKKLLIKSLENIKPVKLSEELLSFSKLISNNNNLEQSFINFALNSTDIINKSKNLTFEEVSQKNMFKIYLESRTDEQLKKILTRTNNTEEEKKIKETIQYILGKNIGIDKNNVIDRINKFKDKFKSEIDNKKSLSFINIKE